MWQQMNVRSRLIVILFIHSLYLVFENRKFSPFFCAVSMPMIEQEHETEAAGQLL